MKKTPLQELVKLANALDQRGLRKEADKIDFLISSAVKYSGKDTWKYKSEPSNYIGEFSRDSAGIWTWNVPDFVRTHRKEINQLEVGQSVDLKLNDGEKVKVTRTSKVSVEDAQTPEPPTREKLIEELTDERKSLERKRKFVSRMMRESPSNKLEELWPYLDKGRQHEEWRLEYSDEPDDDSLVSKIPLNEKTTDLEIKGIADQLVDAVEKLRSRN